LPESIAVDWFTEILLGMKHVHDRKVLHRDLKTQNVFLTADGRCRLGDFGVSKVLNGTHNLASTAVGTPYYLSPEICVNKKYDHKSDVWSLGCVLYELCSGAHPFDAASLKLLVAKITKGIYAPVPGVSPEVSLAIKAMLQRDARKRPSVNELLQRQPFVSRAEALLDEKTFAAEFSHTVLHARDKNNAVCVKQDVFSDFFADKAREAPKENKDPPEREQRTRTPPLAPFAPRVPTRRVPSPPRVAETKKTYAEPVPSFLPRVVAVKKKTRDVSAYPRAAPLPFRRAREIARERERDPSDAGHAAYGGGERAQARARAELERRESEAAREREARERRHRERAALEAASRRRAEEAESRVAERDRARREFKERQAVLRAARRDAAADASAGGGRAFLQSARRGRRRHLRRRRACRGARQGETLLARAVAAASASARPRGAETPRALADGEEGECALAESARRGSFVARRVRREGKRFVVSLVHGRRRRGEGGAERARSGVLGVARGG
jgi:NIMA (never in mitosis gene a)-related kinase